MVISSCLACVTSYSELLFWSRCVNFIDYGRGGRNGSLMVLRSWNLVRKESKLSDCN